MHEGVSVHQLHYLGNHSRLTGDSGRLELITWEYTDPQTKDRMGWGNVIIEEAEDMKRKFQVDCRGKKSLLFKKWPQAFRWTCCGTDGGMNWGCDHHGSGSKPCTCDFCR